MALDPTELQRRSAWPYQTRKSSVIELCSRSRAGLLKIGVFDRAREIVR
jgi:hypothetical protein